MATEEIERIMVAMASLQADVEWLKRGVIGIFAIVGTGVLLTVMAFLAAYLKH